MNTEQMTSLAPKLVGFWTRCIRETARWSQEALAASSGLNVRTIQRIENGEPTNVTTRRALARGLGYDNPDTFDDPEFIKTVHTLLDDLQRGQREQFIQQFPDHISLTTTPVKSGDTLGRLAESSEAYLFHSDDEISLEAKEVAAQIFDFLHDLGDIADSASHSDKIIFNKELDALLKQLEALGASAYSASRSTKMVGDHWPNKTPIPLSIGYLTIVPKEKEITQMMVPRKLS